MNLPSYKYLLKYLNNYNEHKDFNTFMKGVVPMFKNLVDLIYILRALRRFLTKDDRESFDIEMEKHFVVV